MRKSLFLNKKLSIKENRKPEKLKQTVMRIFYKIQKSFLLVIDNANDLIKREDPAFPEFINELLNTVPALKVLISAHYYQVGFQDIQVVKLENLKKEEAVELFFDKMPTKNSDEQIITWEHIEELDNYTLLKRQGKF